MSEWAPIENIFCKTGEKGGVDPTCSLVVKEKSSSEERIYSIKELKKMLKGKRDYRAISHEKGIFLPYEAPIRVKVSDIVTDFIPNYKKTPEDWNEKALREYRKQYRKGGE